MIFFLAEIPASHCIPAFKKYSTKAFACCGVLCLRGKKKKKKSSQTVGWSVMGYLKFPTQRRGYFFKGSAVQPLEQRTVTAGLHSHHSHQFISWLIERTVAWTLYSVLNLRGNKNIKFLSSVPALSQLPYFSRKYRGNRVGLFLAGQTSNFK